MTRADTIVGAGLAIAFLTLARAASTHTYQTEFAPGPGFAPLWLGIIGAALSAYVAVAGLRGAPAPEFTRAGVTRALTAIVGLFLALAAAETVGFILAMTIYLLFVTLVIERMRPIPAFAASAGTMLLVYLVFVRFLNVPLPAGPLGS